MEKVQHKFYYQNKAARSIMLLVFICEVHSPSQKIVLQPQWVSSNKAVRRSQENPISVQSSLHIGINTILHRYYCDEKLNKPAEEGHQ